MLTRKDFQIIANGIAVEMRECIADRAALVADRDNMSEAFYQTALANTQVRINMLDRMALGYAGGLAGTNPAFDRPRFLTACGFRP